MIKQLKGLGTALATPFNKDLEIDYKSLKKLIEYTLDGGVNFLVILGTTGENATLSWKEKLKLLEFVLKITEKHKPILFGLGGNNTYDLIKKGKQLKHFNIDGILSVCPYYSKPTQLGIIRHFNMLADSLPFPIILYNVPSRTGTNMTVSTTLALSKHENIIGIKEASEDIEQCINIIKKREEDFLVFTGNDSDALKLIQEGADGSISVASNLVPNSFATMVNYALSQNIANATKINKQLKTCYHLLFKEGNPSSVKAGLSVKGICKKYVRPPLYDSSNDLMDEWQKFFKDQESIK